MSVFPHDRYELGEIRTTPNSRIIWVERTQDGAELVLKAPVSDEDAHASARFEREIKALKACAGSATMPLVDHASDFSWYVMPRAVRTLAQAGTPMTPEDSVKVLEVMAEALGPAHRKGQVHRDLKPENILLLREGGEDRWVVSDFGIVRNPSGSTSQQLTQAGSLVGTENWAAPEQYVDAHACGPQADIYSAALVLAWMLTGKKPIQGRADVPIGMPVAGVLACAMSEDPRDRYPTFGRFLEKYRSALSEDMPSLERVLAADRYDAAHRYVLRDVKRWREAVRVLPRVSGSTFRRWSSDDAPGLVKTLDFACRQFLDHPDDLSDDEARAFVLWLCTALPHVFDRDQRLGGDLARPVFKVLSRVSDDRAVELLLEFFDRQPDDVQITLRHLLQATDTWSTFASTARRSGRSEWDSGLVNDLAAAED